jgi:CHAT domain-containing protein/Tfp pilus assembly protein PilF
VIDAVPADVAASRDFALDLDESALAQRFADRKRLREPATTERAAALCTARLQAGDDAGYLRCVGLQERIFGAQSQRAAAVISIERALPLWERSHDPRRLASALNNLGMHHYRGGDGAAALPPLRRALETLTGVDDTLLRALVQSKICLAGDARDSADATRRCYEEALALSQASGDGPRIATALNNLGGAYWQLGDTTRAAEYFEQAVARSQSFDDRRSSGDPLNNLALVALARGRLSDAARGFERAASVYEDGTLDQVRALRNQGAVQQMLGESARAADLQQRALDLVARLNRPDETVATLTRLADAQLDDGRVSEARLTIERAVAAAQAGTARPQLVVESRVRAARILRRSGAPDAAFAAAQLAFDASGDLDRKNLRERARVELGLGELHRGNAAQAQRHAETALASDWLAPVQQIDAQTLRADALRAQGRTTEAEAAYRDAVAATERAGSYVFDLEQRALFLAGQRDAQIGLIRLLMDDRDARGGYRRATEALLLSAGFQARSLRSRLDAMPLPAATDATAASQRERLLARLAALALNRWKLQDTLSAERRRRIDADIRLAEAELRTIDAATGMEPARKAAPLELAQLQRALPDDATLVVYRTLPDTSYAWVVRRDAIDATALASQDRIATAVREARAALGADQRGGGDWKSALAAACAQIWQPIAARVVTRRVLVVGDTALDGLPFAALRCGDVPAYLLERHEFALLPATWLLLREPLHDTPRDLSALLVGDPVYTRDDPRFGGPILPASADVVALRGATGRLRGSGDEVRRVQARLGTLHSTLLDGFQANLDALQKAALPTFSILHFATHGTEDRSGVSGAGLVLSLFDANGRDIDGFLSARRIGASRLPVPLVVLGACDTASGRAVAGEGMFGVAYAFLQAGARHVVATLWPVDDASMPELMDRFYADPRLAVMRPAQALRTAQLALLERYPQANPALWAGVAVWGW